ETASSPKIDRKTPRAKSAMHPETLAVHLETRTSCPRKCPRTRAGKMPAPPNGPLPPNARSGFASSIETPALPGCMRRWIMAGSRPFLFALLGLAVAMGAVGCGPFVDQFNLQDRADEPAGELGSGENIAERFVARCDGLTA